MNENSDRRRPSGLHFPDCRKGHESDMIRTENIYSILTETCARAAVKHCQARFDGFVSIVSQVFLVDGEVREEASPI